MPLSNLWHPTQILADLLTLHEQAHFLDPSAPALLLTQPLAQGLWPLAA